jgi:hypothetical protein
MVEFEVNDRFKKYTDVEEFLRTIHETEWLENIPFKERAKERSYVISKIIKSLKYYCRILK